MFHSGGTKSYIRWLLFLFILILIPTMVAGVSPQPTGPTFSKSFSPSTIGAGNLSILTFTITNSDTSSVTDLAFTDILPTGVTIAEVPGVSTTCDGTVTAPANGDTISFVNGRVGATSSCSIKVNVTAGTPGTYDNESSILASSAGPGTAATASLVVDGYYLTFSKSFSKDSISLGQRATLTFNIGNPVTQFVNGIGFTDTLPAGMVIADPANITTTCIVEPTAEPGTSSIVLSNFLFTSMGSCSMSVDVLGNTVGVLDNVSGSLTGSSGPYGSAFASLEVTSNPLVFIKDFPDDPVGPGGTASLTFTISNLDRSASATNISFTDDLDDMLVTDLAANNTPLVDPCGPGSSLTGSTVLTFSGGSLAADESCTFGVTLEIPTTANAGAYENTTSAVSADLDGSPVVSAAASEYLFIQPAPRLVKTFIPGTAAAGDTVTMEFTMTNPDPTRTVTVVSFSDPIFSGVTPGTTNLSTCSGSGATMWFGYSDPLYTLYVQNVVIPAGQSCTATADLVLNGDIPPGIYDNTTSAITGTFGLTTYTGSSATDSLTVIGAPKLRKDFTDDPVSPGEPVTLEFMINNLDYTNAAAGLAFTDDLDAALSGLIATGLPQYDICGSGSSLTGTSTLTFTNGSLAAGDTCTFSVILNTPSSATTGTYTNTTSDLTGTVGGYAVTGSPASGDLLIGELSMTKAFTDDPALPGGNVNLRFVITNNSTTAAATVISFTDDLDAVITGLAPSISMPVIDPCNSGSQLNWSSGDLTLTGGNLAPNSSCTIDVPLTVPTGIASGNYFNRTTAFSGTMDSTPVTFLNAKDTLEVNSDLLQSTKSFTDDPVPPGGTGTLAFTITNLDGTRTITDIAFSDDLDAALSGLAATALPANDSCGAGSTMTGTDNLVFSGGILAPGGSCTLTVSVQVPAGASGGTSATNTTSSVTGKIGPADVNGPAASDHLIVNDVAFSKAFSGPALQVDTTTLSFTIENKNATGAVDSLNFTDDLNTTLAGLVAIDTPKTAVCGPDSMISGTSTLILTRGYLEPGQSCTFDVTVQTPFSGAAGNYTNTTSVLMTDSTMVADPATATLTIQSRYYTISGKVTDSGTSQPIPGATVYFSHDTSTVTTDANGDYTKSVALGSNTTITVSQTGYASWSPPSVTYNNLGENKTQNFVGTLQTFTISGLVTNGIKAVSGVTLTFSHDSGSTQTDASGNYTYTVNYGTSTTVTPSKPGYHNWAPASATFTNITGNQTQDFQGVIFTYTVSGQVTGASGPLQGATLTFSHDSGAVQSDASGHYSYTVDYGTTTTITPNQTGYAAWAPPDRTLANMTADQPGQDFVGTLETHELTIKKDGTGDGTVTSDPAGIDCGSTCVGTYDYGTTITLTAAADAGDFFAGWSGGGCSGTGTCRILVQSDQTVTSTFTQLPRSDLAVTKATSTYSPGLGGHLTFVVRATNNGPEDTTGVTVTDVLPAGLTYVSDNSGGSYNSGTGIWTVGALPAGETIDLVIDALYDTDVVVTNTAQITSSSTYDVDPANNTARVTIDATADIADLSVWKLGVPKPLESGDNLVYFITVANFGPAQAANVDVTDAFVAEITGVEYRVAGSGVGYAPWPGSNILSLGTLDSMESKTVWVKGRLAGTPTGGMLINTAEVASTTPDEVSGNNSSTDQIQVVSSVPYCDLSVIKRSDKATAVAGDNVVFTVTGANNGPDNAATVYLADLLSPNLTYVSDDGGGDYDPRTGLWSAGGLANGASATLNITTQVNTDGLIGNTAMIGGISCQDLNPANNFSTLTLNGDAGSDLALWMALTGLSGSPSLDQAALANGDQYRVVVQYENNGPTAATGVQVQMTLPGGVAVVGAVAGSGCYDTTTHIWHVDDPLACTTTLGNQEDTVNAALSTLTLTLEITDAVGVGAGLVTAQIIEPSSDPDMTNNSVTRSIEAGDEFLVDLSISVTATTREIKGGQTAVITVTVRNNGPNAASSVQVLNRIPARLTLIGSYPSQGTYRSDTGVWMVGNLAVNATATLELTVESAGTAGQATFSTEISGVAETEINAGNNSRQLDINILPSSSNEVSSGECFLDNMLGR